VQNVILFENEVEAAALLKGACIVIDDAKLTPALRRMVSHIVGTGVPSEEGVHVRVTRSRSDASAVRRKSQCTRTSKTVTDRDSVIGRSAGAGHWLRSLDGGGGFIAGRLCCGFGSGLGSRLRRSKVSAGIQGDNQASAKDGLVAMGEQKEDRGEDEEDEELVITISSGSAQPAADEVRYGGA